MPLETTREGQDEHNREECDEHTTGIVSPSFAVGPGWQGPNE
jgi:hypothetical protein